MDVVPVDVAVRRGAEVVLDVTCALEVVGLRRATLELGQNCLERLLHQVRQHVQAPAVRHADHDVFDALPCGTANDHLEGCHHHLATVEPEALRALVLLVEELLETLRDRQPLEDRELALRMDLAAMLGALQVVLDPGPLDRVLQVHELEADAPAIVPAQHGQDLSQRRALEPELAVDEDWPVVVALREAVARRVEVSMRGYRLELQRVEIRLEMTAHAISPDQRDRAYRIAGRGFATRRRRGCNRRGARSVELAERQKPSARAVVEAFEELPGGGIGRLGCVQILAKGSSQLLGSRHSLAGGILHGSSRRCSR